MPVVCIANQKGGTGKTSMALNLAYHLQPNKIIDLDIHSGFTNINSLREKPLNVLSKLSLEQLDKELDSDDMILVDCGGYDSELIRIALSQSDYIVTPSNDDPTEQFALNAFNQVLHEVSLRVGEKIYAHVVLNKVHHARREFVAIDDRIVNLPYLQKSKRIITHNAKIPQAMVEGKALKGGGTAAQFGFLADDIFKSVYGE